MTHAEPVLAILRERGPCTVHELSVRLTLAETAVRRTLTVLLRYGMVRRSPIEAFGRCGHRVSVWEAVE